jgi:hypothetical protein
VLLPHDTQPVDWQPRNLQLWNNLLKSADASLLGSAHAIGLAPLEAKALHVFGLLAQAFEAAGHLLHSGRDKAYGDYYLHAYLLACSTVELLARCKAGDQDLTINTNAALESGLKAVGLDEIHVGLEGYVYDPQRLVALRNLAAHGQGIASVRGRSISVFLHVELLDHFPERLMRAFDDYYDDIFRSADAGARKRLAVSGVEPVLYSSRSGQVFRSPIKYAYERIYSIGSPSKALRYNTYTDWQVYKG